MPRNSHKHTLVRAVGVAKKKKKKEFADPGTKLIPDSHRSCDLQLEKHPFSSYLSDNCPLKVVQELPSWLSG